MLPVTLFKQGQDPTRRSIESNLGHRKNIAYDFNETSRNGMEFRCMSGECLLCKCRINFIDSFEDGPAEFHPAFQSSLAVHKPRRSIWGEVFGRFRG